MAVKTTTEVKSSASTGDGNYVKSLIDPGNYTVKINSIFLQPERDIKFGTRLILNLETKPIGGNFKGFAIDKADATKGNHLGRVGNVGYSKYSFRDFVPDGGEPIYKEVELQYAIQELCKALGLTPWFHAQEAKEHPDMEALIKAFDAEKPFKDIWFDVCIAGREYLAQGKYVNYEMFFPFASRTLGVPYHRDATKVIKFFRSEHVIPLSAEKKTNDTTTSAPTNQTTHTEPAKPAHQSAQELAFIEEGKKEAAAKTKQSNAEFAKEMNDLNPAEPENKDIIQNQDENPYMPWDPEYATWKPGDKGPQ